MEQEAIFLSLDNTIIIIIIVIVRIQVLCLTLTLLGWYLMRVRVFLVALLMYFFPRLSLRYWPG